MLPVAAARWSRDVTGGELVAVEPFAGATSSSVSLLTFDDGTELVLRVLAGSGVAAPEPVTVDERGEFCGRPAVMMSRLAGCPDLSDASPERLRALALALSPLHALPLPDGLPAFAPYLATGHRYVPPWARDPQTWLRAGGEAAA